LTTFRTFTGKHYNISGLRQKLLGKGDKKIVILNFPNNPTGYTPTEAEAEAIREVFLEAAEAGKKIVAIIDDAYFGLVYEKGIFRESIFTKLLDLHKNILAIKLDGATKEDYVWGFRVGFITFGMKGLTAEQLKALEDKAAGLVRSTISSSSNIAQRLLVEAYNDSRYDEEKKAKHAILEGRYKAIKKILRNHQEYKESFKAMPFNSGYFMCIKPNGVDAEELRKHLIAKYSTGTIMLDGLIRLAFSAVPTEKLEQLFANVDAAVRDLKKTAMEKGE
jgi:aspartate/methionine/tyrosine aminotransferase